MRKKRNLALLLGIFLFVSMSFGQTSSTNTNLRRNIATIMFASLGGAVLGLSTLSFYGEPQQHIGNIWMGLGIGAIGGSAYVLSDSNPSSYAIMNQELAFNKVSDRKSFEKKIPLFSWEWTFN